MIFLLLLLLNFCTNLAFGLTLEDDCRQIQITPLEIREIHVGQSDCQSKRLKDRFGLEPKKINTSFVKGFDKDEYYAIYQAPEDTIFCQFPADHITLVGKKPQENIEIWNGKKKITEVAFNTNVKEILTLNAALSTPGKNVCHAFPEFSKVRKLKKESVPATMPRLKKSGGYMVFSSQVPSIFFMSHQLDKIEYSMMFSKAVLLEDAVIKKDGNLAILTREKEEGGEGERICIEDWDPLAYAMVKETCKVEKHNPQLLFYLNDKLIRVHSRSNEIFSEELRADGTFASAHSLQLKRPFNLHKAIVFED